MTEFNMNKNDKTEKPLKGLQDEGMVNFVCEDCGKLLLVLQLTSIAADNTPKVLTRVVVKCGDCGGFSYSKQISGQFHPGTPDDNTIFDIAADNSGAPAHDVIFEAWSK